MALVQVGADKISDITQNTRSAILLKSIYETCRDYVLRAHPWKFAVKRSELAPNSVKPEFEWTYTYDEPNDLLRILQVWPDAIPYACESGKLLCNEALLKVKYIWRNTDESSWDSNFAKAFATVLARDVAYSLTQSSALVEECQKNYQALLAEARSMSAMEGTMQSLEADVWSDARRYAWPNLGRSGIPF